MNLLKQIADSPSASKKITLLKEFKALALMQRLKVIKEYKGMGVIDLSQMSILELLDNMDTIITNKDYDSQLSGSGTQEERFINLINSLSEDKSIIDSLLIGEKHNATEHTKVNRKAMDTYNTIVSERRPPTLEEEALIKLYRGKKGEDAYYTPKFVADACWGYIDTEDNDIILDPSSGMGIFTDTKPSNVTIKQIELDETTYNLNKFVNGNITKGIFEEVSFDKYRDNSVDGVVTNVPFGAVSGDFDYPKGITRIEQYFIIRSLELLKYGKKLVVVVPTGVMDNKDSQIFKRMVLDRGVFLGGTRLPNKVFSGTGADVATDILVFQKHPKEVYEALKENYYNFASVEEVLYSSDFATGIYFKKHKNRVIGITISNISDFKNLFRNGKHGTKVLTPLDIKGIEEELGKKTTKFKNTVDYTKLILKEGVDVGKLTDIEAFRDFVRQIASTLKHQHTLTNGELALFNKYLKTLALNDDGLLIRTLRGTDALWAVVASLNKGNDADKYLEALMIGLQPTNKITNFDRLKELNPYIVEILKGSKLFLDDTLKLNNSHITDMLNIVKLHYNSIWDTNAMKPIDKNTKNLPFKTLIEGLEISSEGEVDITLIPRDVILNSDDIYLSKTKGKVIGRAKILTLPYTEALEYVSSIEVDSNDLEMVKKLLLMQKDIKDRRRGVTPESISLTHTSLPSFFGVVDPSDDTVSLPSSIQTAQVKYLLSQNSAYTVIPTVVKNFRYKTSITQAQFFNINSGMSDILKVYNASPELKLKYPDFYKFRSLYDEHQSENARNSLDYDVQSFYVEMAPYITTYLHKQLIAYDIFCDTLIKTDEALYKKFVEKLDKSVELDFRSELDSQPLTHLSKFVTVDTITSNHGYQNEDIRTFSAKKRGIIASGTGVGKTRIELLTAINAIADGTSHRVMIITPSKVVSKIAKDAKDILTQEGFDLVSVIGDSSSATKEYKAFATDSKKKILLLSQSIFEGLSFKTETIKHLKGSTTAEVRAGKEYFPTLIPDFKDDNWKTLSTNKKSWGYLEDSGVDFIIADEAHDMKNSLTGGSEFKFAKGIKGSRRGVLLRAFKEYKNNKVVLASATPFTSSPYEIYTMLKTAGLMSDIDLKSFEGIFMDITFKETPNTIDPTISRVVKVFTGLRSLQLLKLKGLSEVIYRSSDGVSPASTLIEAPIVTDSYEAKAGLMKERVKLRELLKELATSGDEVEVMAKALELGYRSVSEMKRNSSTFSLLNKLNYLAYNDDWGLGRMRFPIPRDWKEGDALIAELESKTIEERIEAYVIDAKTGDEVEKVEVTTIPYKDYMNAFKLQHYSTNKDFFIIHTLNTAWLKIALSRGLSLNIDEFQKLKELKANLHKEYKLNPKGKHLIFVIKEIGVETIKHFLGNEFNLLIASDSNKDTFADKFNSSTEPIVCIFQKAYSKGVDLNIGVTSIHLVDVPYTPDVYTQAIGRGVRQGNTVENVNVYKYYGSDTTEMFMIRLLQEKGGWQEMLVNLDNETNSIDNTQVDIEAIIQASLEDGKELTMQAVDAVVARERANRASENDNVRQIKEDLYLSEIIMLESILGGHPNLYHDFIAKEEETNRTSQFNNTKTLPQIRTNAKDMGVAMSYWIYSFYKSMGTFPNDLKHLAYERGQFTSHAGRKSGMYGLYNLYRTEYDTKFNEICDTLFKQSLEEVKAKLAIDLNARKIKFTRDLAMLNPEKYEGLTKGTHILLKGRNVNKALLVEKTTSNHTSDSIIYVAEQDEYFEAVRNRIMTKEEFDKFVAMGGVSMSYEFKRSSQSYTRYMDYKDELGVVVEAPIASEYFDHNILPNIFERWVVGTIFYRDNIGMMIDTSENVFLVSGDFGKGVGKVKPIDMSKVSSIKLVKAKNYGHSDTLSLMRLYYDTYISRSEFVYPPLAKMENTTIIEGGFVNYIGNDFVGDYLRAKGE